MKASPARILLGLVLGAALGYLCLRSHSPLLLRIPGIVAPVGTLFINAIRVCVIPLVTGSLVIGCAASSDAARLGKLAGRSLALVLGYLALSAVFAGVLSFTAFRHIHALMPPADRDLSSAAAASSAVSNSFGAWVAELIPSNLFKAAGDGALLPLVTLSLAVGLTLSRMPASSREPLFRFFQSLTEVFARLIDVVLRTAPIGVFCLAVNLPAAAGLSGARALLGYVATLSAVSGAFILVVLYPSVAVFAPVPFITFLRAAAPAQALAFTSRSSLAALPATYNAARVGLRIPDEISNFFFPFAASIFRVGGCMAQVVGICFLASFYGVSLTWAQLAGIALGAIAVSLTVPGVPGGAIIVMSPALASLHIPVAGIAMLLAVDTIPDMFRTTANVAAWLAAGAILSPRRSKHTESVPARHADRGIRS